MLASTFRQVLLAGGAFLTGLFLGTGEPRESGPEDFHRGYALAVEEHQAAAVRSGHAIWVPSPDGRLPNRLAWTPTLPHWQGHRPADEDLGVPIQASR